MINTKCWGYHVTETLEKEFEDTSPLILAKLYINIPWSKKRKHILQEKRKGYDTENQHLSNGKNYYKPPLTSTYFDKY